MKTSLDYLPTTKRRELEVVQRVLMEEFEKALAGGTQVWRRNGKIMKIILFGSFGRGDWVDEPQNGYQSDWDLLIVVSHEKLTAIEDFWWEAEEKLLRDRSVKRPVNIIVHTLTEVNQALVKGEYFWVDIAREGVMLFEQPGHPLATPQPLTPADAYVMAKRYFDQTFESVAEWMELSKVSRTMVVEGGKWANKSAFNLHQAAETAYACFLLVRTLYLPRSHNIKFLRSQSERLDKRLIAGWPRETKKDRSRFELLKRAYVEARYSEHYKISADDLEILSSCVKSLRNLVEQACLEWLETLKANESAAG